MNTNETIKNAVAAFATGGDERNLSKLDVVLHLLFQNIQNGFFDQPGVVAINKADYLGLIEQGVFGGKPRSLNFLSVEVAGNIALVRSSFKAGNCTSRPSSPWRW